MNLFQVYTVFPKKSRGVTHSFYPGTLRALLFTLPISLLSPPFIPLLILLSISLCFPPLVSFFFPLPMLFLFPLLTPFLFPLLSPILLPPLTSFLLPVTFTSLHFQPANKSPLRFLYIKGSSFKFHGEQHIHPHLISFSFVLIQFFHVFLCVVFTIH